MNKPTAVIFALYALVVATNEWWHYGATWTFGPDGWPMSLPGDPPGSAIGHNKWFIQTGLLVIATLVIVGLVKKSRR